MGTMDYSKVKEWVLREQAFDPENLGKCEAVMCLGNGYMGLRSATEEQYVGEKRDLLIAGTFNKFDSSEVTELPNAADVTSMEIKINGKIFHLSHGKILNYERELNIRTGELSRTVLWESPSGDRIQLIFKRIVSMKDKHIIAQQVRICPMDKAASWSVATGINGRMTNNGSQHFSEGDKRLFEKTFMQYTQTTSQSEIDFIFTTGVKISCKSQDKTVSRIIMDRRVIESEYTGTLEAGETLVLEKVTDIRTSRDLEHKNSQRDQIREAGLLACKAAYEKGYRFLAEESRKAWESDVWEAIPIEISSSDDLDQMAIRFAQYHLHSMTPAHDNRMNIGAKGLSGEGYKGHTFWDTDIFALPYFTFSDPKTARKLEEYRYLSLPGAHKKAIENGFDGAQFPWESAWLFDGEVTPVWGAADIITGLPTKIWSGFIEQHITSDVAYGIWQYVTVTGDQEFMDKYGYELMMDTAIFWASRLEWSEKDGLYHINDVVGPDEYKEHVDDNAFTNYMAYWNLMKAMEYYKELKASKQELYEKLNQRMNLDAAYKLWEERAAVIYLPKPDENLIVAQNSTYLTLKDLDLTKYKNQKQVGSMFLDYNLEQVNQIQVSKQADVMILFFLMETLFPNEVKRANWNYYEPRTLHDSSLSLSTHTILACDMGDCSLAYDLFKRAREIDMGNNMKSSNDGVHAASLAGVWQSVVFGFGGVRMLDGRLRINPSLPENWSELKFVIHWHGQRLLVNTTKSAMEIVNETGTEKVNFEHNGKNFEVTDKLTIALQ